MTTNTAPGDPVLTVKNLIKHYSLKTTLPGQRRTKVPAVDGVSFDIEAGTTMALVGESGCGKPTTAKLVLQLEQADQGEVWLSGERIEADARHSVRRLRRNAQMVFQDPYASLTPHMRVSAILREPFIVHRICSSGEIDKRVAKVLESVGLSGEIGRRFPHELSGGQRQRISIARAIAVEPALVICDEPVSALDVSIRSQIVNLLLDLQQSRGLAYLFISHDLGLVEHISDTVAVMYLGKIVETAPSRVFFANPRHPYSAALLASSPTPDPRQRGRPAALRGEISNMGELPSGCRFRLRCPMAISKCAEVEPLLRPVGEGHFAACHRSEDMAVPIPASGQASGSAPPGT
ncbi:ATP-binding cassette domain-containing protein [Devosia rhodophyticola]|uniref:ATP-binding cassette domain-containing protein n=1 Tax=Devosia rhodophyticola TaxID=3026423 RepID=A0ABY7YTR6_9HYPH|nr:oligopeptide/dipeptide ABC transporter ATP-binding protein [Devosia rhodophyticola]WDR04651.1 ATP-binding cassette domain-containing protein [Devosia rhodophyticola]